MKEVKIDEYTESMLKKATESEIKKQELMAILRTEIRISEAAQHLKVIKIILVIFFIAALVSAIIGLFFLSKDTSYNSFYIK